MSWTLHLLVWISVLNMSVSYSQQIPPVWGWGRQHDAQHNWQAMSSAYRYPQQLRRFAPASGDYISQESFESPGRRDVTSEVTSKEFNERAIVTNPKHRISQYKYPQHQRRFAPTAADYSNQENSPIGIDITRDTAYYNEPTIVTNSRLHEDESLSRRSENGSLKVLNTFTRPSRRKGQDSNQIIFPGPTVRTLYSPEIPESCKGSSYCEDVPNYPQEEINKLIAGLKGPMKDFIENMDLTDTPDISQRVGPSEENEELCKHRPAQMIYPQAVPGANGEWYTLLNNKDKPVQGFIVEVCEAAEQSCASFVIFQPGHEGRCVQKYITRRALVVEQKANKDYATVWKDVRLPSCCSCVGRVVIP